MTTHKLSALTSSICRAIYPAVILSACFAPSVTAQEQQASNNQDVEVIEVKGIRGSLSRALAAKQDATNFVDAISAEGIGKLPDNNIAEALQRVTGVAIQRSRGEGDFVSIRGLGPDFVRGTVNGRSIVSGTEAFDSTLSGGRRSSTGRATNFDILPSEVINTLEVVKSASAEHVEGGIGGIVNVKTARPLDVDDKLVVSARATYREFNEETDPNLSALYSWSNDNEDFGFLASLTFSERNIREDFARSFGWLPWGSYDTNLDGAVDKTDVLIPLSSNLDTYQEKRERLTATTTLQWAPDADTEFVIDLLYSNRDINHDETSAVLVALPTGYPANADGSFQVPADRFVDNTLPRILSGLPPELISDTQQAEDKLTSIGLHYSKQMGDWKFDIDASYADASGDLAFDRAVIVGNGAADQGNYLFDFNITGAGIATAYSGSSSLSNPGNYFVRNGRVTRTKNDDEEMALQFDVERQLESDIFSGIKFGMRYRTRDKSIERRDFDGGLGGFAFSNVSGNAFSRGISDFMDGNFVGNFQYNSLIFADTAATLAQARAEGADITPQLDPLGTFDIKEDTYASYIQLDLEGDVGGVAFIGDMGFRVVYTQQDIQGLSRPFTIDPSTTPGSLVFTSPNNQSVEFDDSYVNVLPSLNLRFELGEDLFLRVAGSKSLTRPTFNDLAPSIAINPSATVDTNGDGIAATANLGNTSLAPYESTNYDLGLEWYFGEASALYGGIYYKEIEDFIATITNLDRTVGGVLFDSVSQPDNQGIAQLVGLELGYQQAFESGFGYIFNLSLTENDAEFEEGGDIPFPGVSDISYNATLYYDNGPFEARIAYSYRDDFLLIASDVFANQIFAEAYDQVDASVSYELMDNITLSLELVNLTDEDPRLTTSSSSLSSQFLSESHVGRRVIFGVTGQF